jgi:uncharacterized protein YjbJ (UPF0337 family)
VDPTPLLPVQPPAGFGLSRPGKQDEDRWTQREDASMGVEDKAQNKAEELKGQVKEGLGRATDDEDLQAEGQAEQTKSDLKQAGEKVKDAFKD